MQILYGYEISGGDFIPVTSSPRPTIILRSPETLRRIFLDAVHSGERVSYFGKAENVVPYIPKDRISQTVLFSLSETRPLSFNALKDIATSETPSHAIDAVWPTDIKTTQLDRYLIPACRALAEIGGTLFQLPYIFTSDAFRKKVIGQVQDPAIRYELEHYDARADREQNDQTNSLQNRFVVIKTDPDVRAILAQKNTIEKPGVMIVDLPASERFDFIAALILASLDGVAFIERPLIHLGRTTPILACEYLDELPQLLREKMIGTGTILAPRLGAKDARTLEDYFNVDPGRANLLDMPPSEALVRLDRNHQIVLEAHKYPARPSNLDRIRKNTETRYGAPKSHIDAKIRSFLDGL